MVPAHPTLCHKHPQHHPAMHPTHCGQVAHPEMTCQRILETPPCEFGQRLSSFKMLLRHISMQFLSGVMQTANHAQGQITHTVHNVHGDAGPKVMLFGISSWQQIQADLCILQVRLEFLMAEQERLGAELQALAEHRWSREASRRKKVGQLD